LRTALAAIGKFRLDGEYVAVNMGVYVLGMALDGLFVVVGLAVMQIVEDAAKVGAVHEHRRGKVIGDRDGLHVLKLAVGHAFEECVLAAFCLARWCDVGLLKPLPEFVRRERVAAM
jgi:hypothetical protein